MIERIVMIQSNTQKMLCYEHEQLIAFYSISTGKNGLGELKNSECTPRGWHRVHRVIGQENLVNSVFVAREWTGEIYSPELHQECPERDWIITRIIQLEGMEEGFNHGGEVDSLARYIYIHGTPDSTQLGNPGSRGCIRMRNADVIELADWIKLETLVYIQ